MNRRCLARMCISSLPLRQGLFASLALLVTLIGGQRFQQWDQSQQQAATCLLVHHATQSHFSAFGSRFADATPLYLTDIGQAQPMADSPRQERWVF